MKIKEMQPGWHLLLLCAVFLILMPIVFAVSNSFKTMQDAFNTVFQIIPARPTVQNYIHVFSKLPFLRITMNTFLIAATVTVFKTVTSLFAAYSFVYFDFRGKGILYFIMLATMFIPFTVTMIPNYLMISKIGLSDKIWGVAPAPAGRCAGNLSPAPVHAGNPQGSYRGGQDGECEESEDHEGYHHPVSTALHYFHGNHLFHQFLERVCVACSYTEKQGELYPVPGPADVHKRGGGTEFTIAMAVSVMTMVIPLALYILFQRYIINTFAMSGIKG